MALAACQGRAEAPAASAAPTPRLVSVNPAATAIVDALGASAHLVGVTRYCRVAGVPVVGDTMPPLDRILARTPDAVLIGDYPSQRPLREQLSALGVRVIVVPTVTLADLRASTRALGRELGAEDRASALVADIDEALAAAKARAAQRDRVRALFVFDIQQGYVYTTGGHDHLAELLDAVGADNVAAGGPLTSRLALDAVLARAPELILHAAPSERFPDDAAARRYWREALPNVPAVARGQVYVWPDDRLAQNAPWIASAVGPMADLVAAAAAARP